MLLDVCLQLLSKSLDEVDSEDWVIALGSEMGNQIQLYNNQSEEKVSRASVEQPENPSVAPQFPRLLQIRTRCENSKEKLLCGPKKSLKTNCSHEK